MLQPTDEERTENMKTFKRITAVLIALAMLFGFAACGDKTDTETTTAPLTETTTSYVRAEKTKIAAINGPAGFGMTKFSVDRAYNYETSFYDDAQQVADLLKNGEVDIAALPVDTAAKLYNEAKGTIQMLAVNSLGFYYVIENGEKIQSISDLKGKTVYAAYKGTAYEAVINYIFAQNGIDPEKDIDLQFKADDAEVAALTGSGESVICILSEPYASKVINNEETCRKALDMNAEWDKVCDTPLVQGVVVARTEYINLNPDIVKEFISFNKISVNYLKTNTYGAPVFLKDNGFCETAILATILLPSLNLSFIDGADMKNAANAVLANVYQLSVEDAFYYGI